MAQTLQNVVICTTGQNGGSKAFAENTPTCLSHGVVGYPVVVKAYLSDEPIVPSAAGSSSGGGVDVNVSADIFVGAALVLCVALGWIAGGQR